MADKMMRIAGRGEDGTAKAIRTNENGDVGVELANVKSESITVRINNESISDNPDRIVYESDKPFEIDLLEFAVVTDSPTWIELRMYNDKDEMVNRVIENTSSIMATTPTVRRINDFGSRLWEMMYQNDNVYKMALRITPYKFPNGGKLAIYAGTTATHNFSLIMFGRSY